MHRSLYSGTCFWEKEKLHWDRRQEARLKSVSPVERWGGYFIRVGVWRLWIKEKHGCLQSLRQAMGSYTQVQACGLFLPGLRVPICPELVWNSQWKSELWCQKNAPPPSKSLLRRLWSAVLAPAGFGRFCPVTNEVDFYKLPPYLSSWKTRSRVG